MISINQLQALFPHSISKCSIFLDPINQTFQKFLINTPERQSAFLAQVGHESGGLIYTKEIWGPTTAQMSYEGRKDLGNTVTGDGKKYMGRGLIQITGRANYDKVGKALGVDLINNPVLLEQPLAAALSAGWFWQTHGLNDLADKGDFIGITKRINGGTNGLADRQALYAKAKQILGVK
jgi:putative chitinase